VAQALIDVANENGGEDNISAVVILMESAEQIEPEEPPDPAVYRDTSLGLYQSPVTDDDEEPTVELPDSPLAGLEDKEKDED
jgi:serine/threonine protein phosphatase PrpC